MDQISVYGVSYGTIPAHLYGYFYPSLTRAVVLEGTVYRSDDPFFQNSTRSYYVQKYFNELPENIKNKVSEYSAVSDLEKNWFSRLTSMLLYSDDSEKLLNDFLVNVFNSHETTILILLKNFSTHPKVTETDFSGVIAQAMIGCQEMSMNTSNISFYSNLENGQFIPDQKNHFQELYCKPLGFNSNDKNKAYFAEQFKTKVFTSYIQGESDGATPADLAEQHFQNATLNQAQFLLSKNGGHISIYSGLASGYEALDLVQSKSDFLKLLLDGKRLNSDELSLLKKSTNRQWIHKNK